MPLAKIKAMLQEVIGLHSSSIGDASIERAIHHRMKAMGIKAVDARGEREYLHRIQQDQAEFNELVEEVVVPETWFFRNVFPFDALASYLSGRKQGGADETDTEVKILSLPCSTGEEPYSIAMVLMEDPLIGRFSIDAHDISQRAIRKARRAIYGQHSFREEYRGLREKYFHRTRAGYVLDSAVKEKVAFSQANIIADDFDHKRSEYDVIFCRNLLIYFDRPTQARVLKKLHRMLKSGGILCVGHAEAAQVTRDCFVPLDFSMAFAFRKVSGDSGTDPSIADNRPAVKNKSAMEDLQSTFHQLAGLVEKDLALGRRLSRSKALTKVSAVDFSTQDKKAGKARHSSRKALQKGEGEEGEQENTLEQVLVYLELGRLNDASEMCESHLKENPQSADAYYYLGLISHRQGSQGAAESLLRKAVYLDPAHYLALGELAQLAEKRGDNGLAKDYRRRQKRVLRRREGGNTGSNK